MATIDGLRAAFPEFASPVTYPDTEIQFWLDLGPNLLNAPRWGGLYDLGLYLVIAHNLSLDFNAKRASATGQNPGFVVGAVTSGAVDKVSYSRDPGAAMDPKNGHWNLTTYGLRYVRFMRMVGAGPLQIGTPSGDPGVGAWPGPWQSIFPNPS